MDQENVQNCGNSIIIHTYSLQGLPSLIVQYWLLIRLFPVELFSVRTQYRLTPCFTNNILYKPVGPLPLFSTTAYY